MLREILFSCQLASFLFRYHIIVEKQCRCEFVSKMIWLNYSTQVKLRGNTLNVFTKKKTNNLQNLSENTDSYLVALIITRQRHSLLLQGMLYIYLIKEHCALKGRIFINLIGPRDRYLTVYFLSWYRNVHVLISFYWHHMQLFNTYFFLQLNLNVNQAVFNVELDSVFYQPSYVMEKTTVETTQMN